MQKKRAIKEHKRSSRKKIDKTEWVEYINQLKNEKGLKVKDISTLTGIDRSTVSQYLGNNKRFDFPRKDYF